MVETLIPSISGYASIGDGGTPNYTDYIELASLQIIYNNEKFGDVRINANGHIAVSKKKGTVLFMVFRDTTYIGCLLMKYLAEKEESTFSMRLFDTPPISNNIITYKLCVGADKCKWVINNSNDYEGFINSNTSKFKVQILNKSGHSND